MLIFKATDVVNFAQGEFIMIILSGVMGVVLERVILRPIISAPTLSIVIATIGAYTAAVLAESLHWPFVLCVWTAAIFAALVGYLLGLPCLRLSGLYLAMAMLGFTLIVPEMLLQLAVITHGSEGMSVPSASILGFKLDSDYRKYYFLCGVTVVMLILARNLI